MKHLIILALALGAVGCGTVEKAKHAVYDKIWEGGLAYCQAPDSQREGYRQRFADELAERAEQAPAEAVVPKGVTVECGPR